ncbi:MAG: pilus assembly protein CpaE [Paracoccaceae bacterium]|jgi:pilus assembly protein CpaE
MQLPRFKARQVDFYVAASDFALFDGVAEELDAQFGDNGWSSIGLDDVAGVVASGAPAGLEGMLFALSNVDEHRAADLAKQIAAIKALRLPVVLLLKDVGPSAMHTLIRAGAFDFVPYPTPDGALTEALQRMRNHDALTDVQTADVGRKGVVLPVFSLSGGAGGTTFAVNLAWELAQERRKAPVRVCLLDLDFQFGSVSTYLDMPRQEALMELLSTAGVGGIDRDALAGAFSLYKRRLSVMTSPTDAMPMDIVNSDEIDRIIKLCASAFDYVVLDLPHTLTSWTERVLANAETFFAVTQMDMRSAQNTLRFLRLLKAEELPLEKLEFVMNRAPGFANFGGRGRVKRMGESLGIEYALQLPDGGRQVSQACDHGQPLAEYASGNALRKEIKRIAASLKVAADQRKAGAL